MKFRINKDIIFNWKADNSYCDFMLLSFHSMWTCLYVIKSFHFAQIKAKTRHYNLLPSLHSINLFFRYYDFFCKILFTTSYSLKFLIFHVYSICTSKEIEIKAKKREVNRKHVLFAYNEKQTISWVIIRWGFIHGFYVWQLDWGLMGRICLPNEHKMWHVEIF